MPNIDRVVYDNMRRVLQAAGQLEQVTESFCTNSQERIATIFLRLKTKTPFALQESLTR